MDLSPTLWWRPTLLVMPGTLFRGRSWSYWFWNWDWNWDWFGDWFWDWFGDRRWGWSWRIAVLGFQCYLHNGRISIVYQRHLKEVDIIKRYLAQRTNLQSKDIETSVSSNKLVLMMGDWSGTLKYNLLLYTSLDL